LLDTEQIGNNGRQEQDVIYSKGMPGVLPANKLYTNKLGGTADKPPYRAIETWAKPWRQTSVKRQ